MRKIIVTIAVAVCLGGISLTSAAALTWQGHTAYVLRDHHHKCATNYHRETIRVKGKRTVGCVYMSPVVSVLPATVLPSQSTSTTIPGPVLSPPVSTPSFTYKAHTDPSFVQSAANPKAVTYTYTADAIETLGAQQLDLAQENALPSGILDLYSNGSLACSVNVGGATTGGTCGVTYSSYGQQTVVSEYIPSAVAPVTETDTEDIEPFSTSTAIGTSLVGSDSDVNNWAYQTISVPVTISGLTQSLGTSGTISLTNTDAISESCQALSYSAQLGSASATCTAQVENDPNVTTSWTPAVTFSGDTNYSSSGASGSAITVPVAPAPTVVDIATEVQCAESGGFCSEYNSSPETTSADANVFAGPTYQDVSPNVGTVTFTSADHLLICTASVYSAAGIPSNNARCTGNGGPFEGPETVAYSGASIETGDTVVTNYLASSTSGGSN